MACQSQSNTLPNDERLLVHLSNFRPVKRVLDVIEIFDRVRKKIPSKLLLIGDGPDRSQAEWLAVQKGIHEQVLFLGKQDQIREKLAISDVMLVPSELESFGLAAFEGMACEVVPIATRSGGVPEVIEHGVTGFLADVGDVDTMARYAIDLLGDESDSACDGKTGARHCREKFCIAPARSFRFTKTFTKRCWSSSRSRHQFFWIRQNRQPQPNQRPSTFAMLNHHLRGVSIKHL